MQKMDASFVGTWIFKQEEPFVQDVVLTIYPDGRIAQCYRQGASLSRYIASTMRASAEDGFYRIKTEASAPGYLISIFRDGEFLVIDNRGHRTTCRRLPEPELPGWYPEVMAKAAWR